METTEKKIESARGDGEVLLIEESTPDFLRFEWRRPQGMKVNIPPDLHPTQTETIRVLEGGLSAMVRGRVRRLGPGDQVEVPAGTLHRMVNDPAQPFRAQVTFTPATGMLEFFKDLMQLQASPANLTRFAKRHRQAVRLAQPYRMVLDVMGVFIR